MSETGHHSYEFGPFRLDTATRSLMRGNEAVPLPPKAFETLLLLLRDRERVLPKKELIESLWPDSFVEEANLTQNIFLLRKALGEEPGEYIKTVPKVGYRFVAAVREVADDNAALVEARRSRQSVVLHEEIVEHEEEAAAVQVVTPTPAVAGRSLRISATALIVAAIVLLIAIAGGLWFVFRPRSSNASLSTPIDSIAVLPFTNQISDADSEYLSDGIAESLINSLTQLKGLRVVPRSTVFRYKGRNVDPQTIGRELKVRAVLVGRVLRHGDTLSIQAELIDIDRESQLWGEQYNRNFADLLAIQENIAKEISQRLRFQLSGPDEQGLRRGSTANPEAYHLYLKGIHYTFKFTKEGFRKGAEFFNQAIALDPNYAMAYDGLAFNYINSVDWFLPPSEGGPKARRAAEQALALDERLADAHCSAGLVANWFDWNWATAEREFKRGIELNANEPRCREYYSWLLATLGRNTEAIAEAKQAVQIDPISAETVFTLGSVFVFAREYDQAVEQLRTSVELDQSYWFAHDFLGRAYEGRGDLANAIAEYQRALQLEDSNTENWSNLAYAYAQSGKKADVQKIIKDLRKLSASTYVTPYNFAVIYAGLGEKDQAFTWLERAYADRSGALAAMLKVDNHMDTLRSDPRFKDLLNRMNLAP